jgi:hypothetical protein
MVSKTTNVVRLFRRQIETHTHTHTHMHRIEERNEEEKSERYKVVQGRRKEGKATR